MTIDHHGVSIGVERIDEDYFISLKAVGKLTHTDYQKITPLLNSALDGVEEQQIRVLFDVTKMDGWELRAAWDDFKLGLKHGKKFKKIAIFGDKNWLEHAINIGSWFVSGEVKFFKNHDRAVSYLREE